MEIAKIVPFKDMQVEKPNTYKMIKSDGTKEIVKLEFAPGIIYEEGTKDNAENFNTIQNNCIYRVDGVRKLEATEEIYDINITNYNNYTDTDISIIMTIDVANTTGSPKIRLNNIKYNIVDENGNVAIGYFKNKNTFIFVIDFYKKTAKVNSIFLPPATPTTIGGVKSIVNDLVTASTDRPLSSNMGKVLQDTKLNLTGGTVTNGTNEVRIGVKYNNLSTDMMYMYSNAGSQGVFSIMPGFSDASVIRRDKITGFVTYAGGTFTGALNGASATFSGNVTAPNLAYDTTQIIAGTGLIGGGDLTTDRTLNIVSANAGIVVNADNIELKPATTSIIGGVKPDGTTTSVDVNGVISTVNRASISTQIIAGTGLTGGGDLAASRTLNIASANDGIIANADNIQLNTIDNLTTASSTKPLSANMGKVLQDTKLDLTGGTLTGALNGTTADYFVDSSVSNVFATSNSASRIGAFKGNKNITSDGIYFNNQGPSQAIVSNLPIGYAPLIQRNRTTGEVTYSGGNYGTINGSTATFSGNVTAPSITIGGYVVTIV